MDHKFVCDLCGKPLILVQAFQGTIEYAVDPDTGAIREIRYGIPGTDYYTQCSDSGCPGPYLYNYELSEDGERIETRWR